VKILNLFAGIGGNRTLWGNEHQITAIENDQRIALLYHKRFPNDKIIIIDAYKYLEEHYKEFDFIWASPPCRTHTTLSCFPTFKKKLPDMRLYSIIIFLNSFFKGKWTIENVISHYKPLIKPTAIVDRHYIWSNFYIDDKKYNRPGNIKDLKIKVLCALLKVDINLINNFKPKNWSNHDSKRQILRNCVLPEAGKYILDCIVKQKQSNLFDFNRRRKLLVITSCSKKKAKHHAKAKDLYNGALFKKVKIFAQKLNADLMILSAKYGLIESSKEIEPYNQTIKTSEDIKKLKGTELPNLERIHKQYTKVIIIMGSKYREVFEPLISDTTKNFLQVYSDKGIGGYLKKLKMMNEIPDQELRRFILA
jgi:DNA (cytosine-5)-methyltransferase 1